MVVVVSGLTFLPTSQPHQLMLLLLLLLLVVDAVVVVAGVVGDDVEVDFLGVRVVVGLDVFGFCAVLERRPGECRALDVGVYVTVLCVVGGTSSAGAGEDMGEKI